MGSGYSAHVWDARSIGLLRDAQALVDCYPESALSAADKDFSIRMLERLPGHAETLVEFPANYKLRYLVNAIAVHRRLHPEMQHGRHGYRGRAEWPAKPTPPVEVDPPPSPPPPPVPAEQTAAAADCAAIRSQMDEREDADELASLLAKKQQ